MTIGSGGSSRGSFSPPGTAASGKNCTDLFHSNDENFFYIFINKFYNFQPIKIN